MSVVIIYSEKELLVYKLANAARSAGNICMPVTINNERLAMNLAERGEKVLAVTECNFASANNEALVSVLRQAAVNVDASTVILSRSQHSLDIAASLCKYIDVVCIAEDDLKGMKGKPGSNKDTEASGSILDFRPKMKAQTGILEAIPNAKKTGSEKLFENTSVNCG